MFTPLFEDVSWSITWTVPVKVTGSPLQAIIAPGEAKSVFSLTSIAFRLPVGVRFRDAGEVTSLHAARAKSGSRARYFMVELGVMDSMALAESESVAPQRARRIYAVWALRETRQSINKTYAFFYRRP